MKRVSGAAVTRPIVRTGSTSSWRWRTGSSVNGTYPPGGRIGMMSANTRSNPIARTYVGMLNPSVVAKRTA